MIKSSNDLDADGGAPGRSRLFCFGLGYTALALADTLLDAGWRVAGTCRDAGAVAAAAARGIDAHILDRDCPLAAPGRALAETTHLLSTVPPDESGDTVLDAHGADIAALMAAAPMLSWCGYLSTTGVYGDRGGGWVDEESARTPSGPRGFRRVAAEDGWLALWREHGVPVHIFRLAGIYGPGRSAFDALRAGTARRIDKPGQVFSRIHVDDIVRVLRASMVRPDAGTAYNVCDDDPAPPPAVVAYAAALLGMAPPPLEPFAEADLSPMARSFYEDNKRVRNTRIKEALGVRLAYPDYRAGLAAILAADSR